LELEAIAKKSNGEDKTFLIKNEIAFHGKLYDIIANDTLKRFQTMLLPIFGYVVTSEEKPTWGKVDHQGLVEIFKNGNKEECREGMYKHLKPYFDRLINSPNKG
jgi:DNA-binding FadR family transcriptional regulator